ncbi:MAG: hypothetical protein GYA39_05630 [Methanothrix sp.]|nr:hypothetical protein [Methanothrix sp.]
MELVYTYEMDGEKAMKKLLDEEFWKRLGPTVRDCRSMGYDMAGMCMYIKARDELAEEARRLLEKSPAKELKGEDGERLLKAFRDEAEAAEAGMGAIFG